jgi:hypothetical protein
MAHPSIILSPNQVLDPTRLDRVNGSESGLSYEHILSGFSQRTNAMTADLVLPCYVSLATSHHARSSTSYSAQ